MFRCPCEESAGMFFPPLLACGQKVITTHFVYLIAYITMFVAFTFTFTARNVCSCNNSRESPLEAAKIGLPVPVPPSRAGDPQVVVDGKTGGQFGYGSIPMKIPFLLGWTSINPSYFDVNRRGTRFWHTAIWVFLLILLISKILLRSCLATKHAFYLSDSWWRSMTETVLHTVTPTHPESSVGGIPLGFQENMVNEQITTVLFTRVFWIITCI